MSTQVVILVLASLVVLWDVARRFAARGQLVSMKDFQDLEDRVHEQGLAQAAHVEQLQILNRAREHQSELVTQLVVFKDQTEPRLADHTQVLANHAQALDKAQRTLSSIGLDRAFNKTKVR